MATFHCKLYCKLFVIFLFFLSIQCYAQDRFHRDIFRLELFPSGTVIQSRSVNERENISPGYWNHLAIISDGVVIESLAGRGVVVTSFDEYRRTRRGIIIVRAFIPANPAIGESAGEHAESLVGLPYRQLSSLRGVDTPRSMRRGVNCDSVIRYSYRQASGHRLRKMRIPDRAQILVDRGILRQPIRVR